MHSPARRVLAARDVATVATRPTVTAVEVTEADMVCKGGCAGMGTHEEQASIVEQNGTKKYLSLQCHSQMQMPARRHSPLGGCG
jgi:hypothetical protein